MNLKKSKGEHMCGFDQYKNAQIATLKVNKIFHVTILLLCVAVQYYDKVSCILRD